MASDQQETATSEQVHMQVILIVEDEEEIGDLIIQFLEQETPYKAFAATNAIQALALVATIKPDLFMLDYQLPGINGLELFDRLHAMQGLEAVPALMFSANALPQKALQKRHITSLIKPFDLDDLLKMVEKLLHRQEA